MKIELVERGLCRIMAETNDELEPIRNFFKTENDNKFFVQHHNPQYSAPDFKYGISALGVFKIGLIMSVLKVMKSLDIKPEVDKKIFENLFPIKHLNIRPLVFELPCESNEDFENRDYQHEAVEKNLKRGRGVTVMATGSGKSFVIAKTLYSLLKTEPEKIKHCLILVPTTNLVIQFYKDLLSYGLTEDEVSMFSSKEKECKNTSIIISNRQWLNNHIDELPHIDVLQVDEAHTFSSPGSNSSDMVANFETNIKFGCTATLPNTIDRNWDLIGNVGPVLYKKNAKDMLEDDYISDLYITSVKVRDKDIDKDRQCLFSLNRKVSSENIQEAYELERKYITDNMRKLYELPFCYIKNESKGTNTLFLFDYIEFGKSFYEFVKKEMGRLGKDKVFYIDGQIDVLEREKIRKTIEETEDAIIVAQSVCFNTGINIKKLHNIGFIFNSKSGTKIIQSIGRGLRKHETKKEMHLYDINFNFKYSERHFKERKRIYKKEYNKDVTQEVLFKVETIYV